MGFRLIQLAEHLVDGDQRVIAHARTVEAIVEQTARLESVPKAVLRSGDRLLVVTENSIYSITVADDATYVITGGWFDRQGLSPARVTIVGCTWGGTAVKRDIVAALGLRLEFGNRVITSRVREVRIIRGMPAETAHFRPLRSSDLFSACYPTDSELS
jgi:hypothetical protein